MSSIAANRWKKVMVTYESSLLQRLFIDVTQAVSMIIMQNRLKKNVSIFLNETRRSLHTTNTADRGDLERIREALIHGDIQTIDSLRLRDRADLHKRVDHITGSFFSSSFNKKFNLECVKLKLENQSHR